jgi:hypothetical protein
LVGRKCRAQSVEVLEGKGKSQHDPTWEYSPGKIMTEPDYDPDIRVECSKGIHFFLTKEEAENY